MSYETKTIVCPCCKVKIEVSMSHDISIHIDEVSLYKRTTPYHTFDQDTYICKAPAYEADAKYIPTTENLSGFLPSTVLDGEEWWCNGHVLFRSRPLTVMTQNNDAQSALSEQKILELLKKYDPTENALPCTPIRADHNIALMEWADGKRGATLRSPVDICAHLWPGGAWHVKNTDTDNPKHVGFTYTFDGKIMCINMSITQQDEQLYESPSVAASECA